MQLLPLAFKGMSTTLATVGTAISAATSVASGMYQSRVANINAQIADQNAARARQEGAVQSQMQDMEATQQIGDIVAQTAASGLDIGVGSGALRRRSAEELATRDRTFNQYNTEKEVAGFQQQASSFRAEGRSARVGGILGGLSSLTELKFPNLIKDAPKVGGSAARRFTRPKRNPIYGSAM